MQRFKIVALAVLVFTVSSAFLTRNLSSKSVTASLGYGKPSWQPLVCTYGYMDNGWNCAPYASGPVCTIGGGTAYSFYDACAEGFAEDILYRDPF